MPSTRDTVAANHRRCSSSTSARVPGAEKVASYVLAGCRTKLSGEQASPAAEALPAEQGALSAPHVVPRVASRGFSVPWSADTKDAAS